MQLQNPAGFVAFEAVAFELVDVNVVFEGQVGFAAFQDAGEGAAVPELDGFGFLCGPAVATCDHHGDSGSEPSDKRFIGPA